MVEIRVLILDDVEEEDFEYLIGRIRYEVKYTDGVGEFEVSYVAD